MSRVPVRQSVLRWAVGRSGKDPADLERKFPRLLEWEHGESQPTLRQLEQLAQATRTPLGFFFLPAPPSMRLPVPYYRTVQDAAPPQPGVDLLSTVQIMQRRQAWMRTFLMHEREQPLEFVRSARLSESPTAIAQRMRQALGLADGWSGVEPNWTRALNTLIEAMEDAGVLVVANGVVGNDTHRSLDPQEFRGFVLVDDYAPLVFVNGADGKAAQMFTLAHELAHVFYGKSAAFDLQEMRPADDPTEQACNWVAAEFLVPEREMRRFWPGVAGEADAFRAVARRFKVSTLVAARRALDLDLIDRAGFLAFYQAYERDERRGAERRADGGDFYATQRWRIGRRFGAAIVRAVREGALLYSDAYELTGLYGRTFEQFADRLMSGAPR